MNRQSINFTNPNAKWIKGEIENNEYNSASELVNDLIRQHRQDEEEKAGVIRELILEGIESGTTDLTPMEIKKQVRQRNRPGVRL